VLVGVLLLAAVGLGAWMLVRRRNQRALWWERTGQLVHDADAVGDLADAGPAGTEPQQQVAHWSTLEQHSSEMVSQLDGLLPDAPDDAARSALVAVSVAATAHLAAVRTERQLRIGPPAPTDEQLQFADADTAQRLAELRAALEPLRRRVETEVPRTSTPT